MSSVPSGGHGADRVTGVDDVEGGWEAVGAKVEVKSEAEEVSNGDAGPSRRRLLLRRRVARRERQARRLEALKKERAVLRTQMLPTILQTPPAPPPRRASSSGHGTPAPSSVVVDVRPRQSARNMDAASAEVKREAAVLAKINRLQQEGLWSEKKLAKGPPEPGAGRKVHWDYVMEEMAWMANVFQVEVKARKSGCKRIAQMVQRHFRDKQNAARREEREREQNKRRVASFMAKEVRTFWGNIEKLFEYRLKTQIDQKRKRALDEHLNFIVDKTEKYSTLLAETLAEQATPATASGSLRTTPAGSDVESVGTTSGPGSVKADGEYLPEESSDDDERTIGKEEDVRDEKEVDLLAEEAEIPVEELLKKFHPELYENKGEEGEKGKDEKSSEDSAKPSENSQDDQAPSTSQESDQVSEKKESVDESQKQASKEAEESKADDSVEDIEDLKPAEKDKEDQDNLKSLVEEDPALFDAVETAEAFQPTGNTLDTTTVKTPVPFLLKHSLREYQHIGLDWLVSLHERHFNGILADEMGLGKTIQTIALLAHLACSKGTWGPHLIVVPTSVMLNWEMEIKKWCPAFKVLTYYGSQKERRLKRVGWTKPDAFHVCITSYKLVIQDHSSFRRKQWYYFILDEAQHIKNFKSQRWQMLLNFSSAGRLLLTGTPLQNNLMELWSLMHFLMPNVFQSHRNFKEWFSNPLTGMVEDTQEYNEGLVRRLHKVLRPFLLRRLKNEVEKQLPKKYEHVVYCPLSKRQRFLYDDFMSRAKTQETLAGGNFMSVINVLMQLRKVCNHPNLFEARPTLSPFVCESLSPADSLPRRVFDLLECHPLERVEIRELPLCLMTHEQRLPGYGAYRTQCLQDKHSESVPALVHYKHPPRCPAGKIRMIIRFSSVAANQSVKEGVIPFSTIVNNNIWIKKKADLNIRTDKGTFLLTPLPTVPAPSSFETSPNSGSHTQNKTNGSNGYVSPPLSPTRMSSRIRHAKEDDDFEHTPVKRKRRSTGPEVENPNCDDDDPEDERRGIFSSKIFAVTSRKPLPSTLKEDELSACKTKIESLVRINKSRVRALPLYGQDLIESLSCLQDELRQRWMVSDFWSRQNSSCFENDIFSVGLNRFGQHHLSRNAMTFLSRFHVYVPAVLGAMKESRLEVNPVFWDELSAHKASLERLSPFQFHLQLPETRLIQYDCGKLQVLSQLLHRLKSGGHRVLLFTQMTKVLDVLEAFLNYHGYVYLRLDGSTRVEQRQVLMERFNNNDRYFCFILSTRSGGVGVNLTGADTVVFYDSDWNLTMDAQAQDRCHRIGQTRDVHIYRLVSERTVEENILKKANQKRMLGDLAIDGGNFTTAQLKARTIKELFAVTDKEKERMKAAELEEEEQQGAVGSERKTMGAFESAIAAAEDTADKEAMLLAKREAAADEAEFDEDIDKTATPEEDAFTQLVSQLSAVERFALRSVEESEAEWKSEQLSAAEAELAAQKRELEEAQREEEEEHQRQLEEIRQRKREEEEEEESEEEDETSDEEGEDDDEGESEELDSDDDEEEEESVMSPRTRSRGDVKIDLWTLDKNS